MKTKIAQLCGINSSSAPSLYQGAHIRKKCSQHRTVGPRPHMLAMTAAKVETTKTLGRNPAPSGSLRARKSPSPPSSHILGSQGQQHMLLPIEGEKLLHGSFPSSTAAQGMCMSLFWGGLRIITDPIQGLPAGLTNGTDKGGRKKNKGAGWKWYCFEIRCCCC